MKPPKKVLSDAKALAEVNGIDAKSQQNRPRARIVRQELSGKFRDYSHPYTLLVDRLLTCR